MTNLKEFSNGEEREPSGPKWEMSLAKFEMCSNVSWLYRGAAFRNAEFTQYVAKNVS